MQFRYKKGINFIKLYFLTYIKKQFTTPFIERFGTQFAAEEIIR